MRLQDKVAIITGAGAGIGAATAKLFAAEGARVAVADWNAEAARAVAADIGKAAIAVAADVRREADVQAMVARTQDAFGGLDILVNNAGKGLLGDVVSTDLKDWEDIVSINLTSVFLCSKHAIPALRARGGGTIVHVASNVAQVGIKARAAYVASKGAVAALTRAMALDHAADQIRVNAVAPGVVWSKYYEAMLASVPDPEAFVAGLKARSPMGRYAAPEEIAPMILWLASAESSFATGGIFTVDGGMTAW